MIRKILVITFLAIFISCTSKNEIIQIETSNMILIVDETGSISSLIDKDNDIDNISVDTTSFLLSVKKNTTIFEPISAKINENDQSIILTYQNGIEARVKYESNEDYLKFELISINDLEIELIIWGPFFTKLNNIIGETVGVVQGDDFAIGVQSLNPRTLGGFPWTNNDCMPQINIFAQDDLTDLSEEGKEHVLYRVEAAKPTKNGSSLQAYCRNRNEERIIENLNHKYFISPAYKDDGIIGSSIALFGCPKEEILRKISKIEINENLPHPMLEGEWNKISKASTRAYLIYDFSEETIDGAIELTKKAGLKYLYHGNPFKTWGHFELSANHFPNGIKGLKRCVEKANKNGIQIGIHTLSNFITTNDKYVTPMPDQRLGKVGGSTITEDVTKNQNHIKIEGPKFFDQFENNNLKTVMIDNELIRYDDVLEENGWKLVNCERGAFGTKATRHSSGTLISKLADHGYKVFLTNPELSLEVSENLAHLFNQTGLRQISFDGLEGNRSTGMGNYGEILFVKNWHDNLDKNIRISFIADASRTSHFFWHLYTRMNWGEPWYAGFRESQTEYRLKNQAYFKRNLMPRMLGWFQFRPETSIEDVEWMLARSAAFDAGFAFVVNNQSIIKNKHSNEIFKLLSIWEEARLAGIFSEKQKEKMSDIKNEFRLTKDSKSNWALNEIYSYKFIHQEKIRQPGEPLFSTFEIFNPINDNILSFILKSVNSDLENITFEIDNHTKIKLPGKLSEDEIIKYEGGDRAKIYNQFWKIIREIPMNENDWKVGMGEHKLIFDCNFNGETDSQANLEIRISGEKESITSK